MRPLKIMFLAANPTNETRLQLAKEYRKILEVVRGAEHRDRLEIRYQPQVLRQDLLPLLVTEQPTIVHFGGHGTPEDEIIFVDENEQASPIGARALGKLFAELAATTQVVVLNACFSEVQAQAITATIPCAVGMSTAISDEAAIEFSHIFYLALGEGSSVQAAFDFAISQLVILQSPEEDTPQLLTRADLSADRVCPLYPDGRCPEEATAMEGWWEHEGLFPGNSRHSFTLEIKNQEGHALTTDSDQFGVGDLILRIRTQTAERLAGECLDPETGEWIGVAGKLGNDYMGKLITIDWAGGANTVMRVK